MKKEALIKLLAGLLLVIAGVLFILARSKATEEDVVMTLSSVETDATGEESTDSNEKIFVHICGAVVNPGMYELAPHSLVSDAIKTAGGFSDDADENYLNLAKEVTNGEQLKVPTKDEARIAWQESQDAKDGIVNINSADVEGLCQLPGIGSARAETIIAYRNEHGPFKTIEDIMNVSGIKEAAFAKIKDKIKVE